MNSQNVKVPYWFGQDTTKTRAAFRAFLNIHDRPENREIDTPPDVAALRELKAKVDEHERFVLDFAKSWTQGIGSITAFLHRASGKTK